MKLLQFFLIFTLFFSVSCKKNQIDQYDLCSNKNYIHIAHTRTEKAFDINEDIKEINFDAFDMLWLGGDLDYNSSQNVSSMNLLDGVFNLSSNRTFWSLGNHDYSDISLISQYTQRPNYYTTNRNGLTIVVLDTQENSGNISGNQKDFLFSILDTIKKSSHLILLHHKLVWMYGNQVLENQIDEVSNGELGNCVFCLNPNNFNEEIYPKLLEVEQKGIDVICIGGDIGKKVKRFEHFTSDGIQFLASGIQYNDKNNEVLVFCHDTENQELNWEFINIKSLHK